MQRREFVATSAAAAVAAMVPLVAKAKTDYALRIYPMEEINKFPGRWLIEKMEVICNLIEEELKEETEMWLSPDACSLMTCCDRLKYRESYEPSRNADVFAGRHPNGKNVFIQI